MTLYIYIYIFIYIYNLYTCINSAGVRGVNGGCQPSGTIKSARLTTTGRDPSMVTWEKRVARAKASVQQKFHAARALRRRSPGAVKSTMIEIQVPLQPTPSKLWNTRCFKKKLVIIWIWSLQAKLVQTKWMHEPHLSVVQWNLSQPSQHSEPKTTKRCGGHQRPNVAKKQADHGIADLNPSKLSSSQVGAESKVGFQLRLDHPFH